MASRKTSSVTSKHVPIHIDAETYTAVKAYAEITGIPIKRVAAIALKDWMDTIGAARLEALTATGAEPAKMFQMAARASAEQLSQSTAVVKEA